MNIKEIIKAWIIAGNPTNIQEELAIKRLEICDNCEFKKQIIKSIKLTEICSECGCPISKKVFSNVYDPCTKHKWCEIDKPYFNVQKNKKTLI